MFHSFLKQELFLEGFSGATVPFLIIYLKAMFCLFFFLFFLSVFAACLFVVIFPHATIFLFYLQDDSTRVFILIRDYMTKR